MFFSLVSSGVLIIATLIQSSKVPSKVGQDGGKLGPGWYFIQFNRITIAKVDSIIKLYP